MKLEKVDFEPDGSKGPPHVLECNLCVLSKLKCGKHCDGYYFELAEEQPLKARKISLKLTGLNQDYEVVEEVIEIPDTGESVTTKESFFDIGARYDFKKEDPEKIQTEYEWVQERVKFLRKTKSNESFIDSEILKHCEYLSANKPEKWENANKDNTKIGDCIKRHSLTYTVKYISESHPYAVLQADDCDEFWAGLCNYVVETYKEKD